MRKSCVIYDSWALQIINLPQDMAGEYTQKILKYAFFEEHPSFDDPALAAMFASVKNRLDEDLAKYQAQVERAKTISKRSRTKSDEVEGVNVNDNVNVNVLDKSNINKVSKDTMSSKLADACLEIIDYLNLKTNKNFKPNAKATQDFIKARLKDGYSIDDFKKVIDNKCEQWLGTEQQQYLRPETLFAASHFESYLNETKVKSRVKNNPIDMPDCGFNTLDNEPTSDSVDIEGLPF